MGLGFGGLGFRVGLSVLWKPTYPLGHGRLPVTVLKVILLIGCYDSNNLVWKQLLRGGMT